MSADEQALADQAVTEYLAYVRSQAAELLPAVQAFAAAYAAGDDETARSLFAATRVPYERIEPTAEAFGDLDPKIDFREVDAVAEGLDWTGFHRIEKDLWPPAAGRPQLRRRGRARGLGAVDARGARRPSPTASSPTSRSCYDS